MSSKKGPVRGTRIDYGRYFLVVSEGTRKKWIPLTRVSEGLPAFYRALADLKEQATGRITIPRLVSDWERDVMARHAPKTQRDEVARGKVIASSFESFTPDQVSAPDVSEFLSHFRSKPRTHNAYRAQLGELMRYAMERGLRAPGTNPVTDVVRTMRTPARDRYVTDSELRRIKVAAMYGDDGRRTRSGPMLCALVDMAYLTGQRIGDLLSMEWSQFGQHGVSFETAKTGAKVLIGWTARLRDVERRLRQLRVDREAFTQRVFTTQEGQPYTYWGASTAWRRAVKRAGVRDCHFHDLRAKALTDKDSREGTQAARTMGAHTTDAQTADYVRHKGARKTGATR